MKIKDEWNQFFMCFYRFYDKRKCAHYNFVFMYDNMSTRIFVLCHAFFCAYTFYIHFSQQLVKWWGGFPNACCFTFTCTAVDIILRKARHHLFLWERIMRQTTTTNEKSINITSSTRGNNVTGKMMVFVGYTYLFILTGYKANSHVILLPSPPPPTPT